MRKSMIKKNMEDKINFKEIKKEKIFITNHFFSRWNERSENKFNSKNDLQNYMRNKCKSGKVSYFDCNCYLIDDIIVIAKFKKDEVGLITTYGDCSENYMMYSILLNKGIKGVRKYNKRNGMLNLAYVA